jgi:hypothetical protein
MNWTNQELEIWIKAGLVPMHLLNPENHLDLINFLRTNKEKLQACYKRNPEELLPNASATTKVNGITHLIFQSLINEQVRFYTH